MIVVGKFNDLTDVLRVVVWWNVKVKVIMNGNFEGRGVQNRSQYSWLMKLTEWSLLNSQTLQRVTQDR